MTYGTDNILTPAPRGAAAEPKPSGPRLARRGFTLIELLLAVFLLTIGMIGLLSIFPIGADWTRQVTEETIAQNVARDALSVIQARYGPGGSHDGAFYGFTSTKLTALPAFADAATVNGKPYQPIPVTERAYQYGAPVPFPAQNAQACVYFWTALARLSPDQPTDGSGHRFEVYILVMKKGQPADSYTIPAGMTEVTGCRATSGETFVPAVVSDTFSSAASAGSRSTPPIGDSGVGETSGTQFRVYYDATNMKADTRPLIASPGGNPEKVLWVPPSNPIPRPSSDPTPSPLVYVCQTTISL